MHLLLQEGSSSFVDWGIIHISVGNLVVIAMMVALFVVAIVVPFPGHHDDGATASGQAKDASAPGGGPR